MITPNQQCLRHLGRCHRLVHVMDKQNLADVMCVMTEFLNDIEILKQEMVDDGHEDGCPEIFDANMRAMRLLLEYSDIFTLTDIERYKESCKCLLSNFILLFKKNEEAVWLFSPR